VVIFCGSRFFPGDILPRNIRLLRFACLDVHLTYNTHVIHTLLAGVVQQLSSPEMTLERLKIRITLSIGLLTMSMHGEEGLKAFKAHLEAALRSIRHFQHVTDVSVQIHVNDEYDSAIRKELTHKHVKAMLGCEATDVTTRP
jgi:hypothetical protein